MCRSEVDSDDEPPRTTIGSSGKTWAIWFSPQRSGRPQYWWSKYKMFQLSYHIVIIMSVIYNSNNDYDYCNSIFWYILYMLIISYWLSRGQHMIPTDMTSWALEVPWQGVDVPDLWSGWFQNLWEIQLEKKKTKSWYFFQGCMKCQFANLLKLTLPREQTCPKIGYA